MSRKPKKKAHRRSAKASSPSEGAPKTQGSPSDGGRRARLLILLGALVIACVMGGLLLTLDMSTGTLVDLPALPELSDEPLPLKQALTNSDSKARQSLEDVEALGRLAMIYHANRYYPRADRVYARAAQLAPQDYRWPYLRALVLAEQGRQEDVVTLLESASQLAPGKAYVHLEWAEVAMKQGQLDLAETAYVGLLQEDPGLLPARIGMARVANRREDWPQVEQLLSPFLQSPPKYRGVHQLLAAAYHAQGKADHAEEQEHILDRRPLIDAIRYHDPLTEKLDELCYQRDLILKIIDLADRWNHYDKMLFMAERAVAIAPEDADAHHALSRALILARPQDPEAFTRAMSHHERGLALQPEDLQPLKYFCQALFEKKRFDIIAPLLERYLTAFPEDSQTYNNLGYALIQNGEAEKAIRYLRRAVSYDPQDPQLRQHLGKTLADQGQIREAIRVFREGLDVEFNLALANNLAWLYATSSEEELRNGEEAVALAEKACEQTRNMDYRLLHTLSAAYAEQGRFVEAADTAQTAFHLAEQAGQPAQAAEIRESLEAFRDGRPHRETR